MVRNYAEEYPNINIDKRSLDNCGCPCWAIVDKEVIHLEHKCGLTESELEEVNRKPDILSCDYLFRKWGPCPSCVKGTCDGAD